MTESDEPARAGLDDLRRRLYRAGATEEDRRRYLETLATTEPPIDDSPVPPVPVRRTRRLVVALGMAAVAVGALAAVVRLELPHAAPAPTATPAASATPFFPGLASGVADIGHGDVLPLSPESPTGPVRVASSIDGMDVVGSRFEGYGNAVVAFDPPPGSWDGGRVSVALTSTSANRVAWRALLVVTRTDWSSYPVVLAAGTAEDRSGAHAPTVFGYPERPPTKVAVEAPEGVGWTLVVAATGARADLLH